MLAAHYGGHVNILTPHPLACSSNSLTPISQLIRNSQRILDTDEFFWEDRDLKFTTAKCSNAVISVKICVDGFPNMNSTYNNGDNISILHPSDFIGASKFTTDQRAMINFDLYSVYADGYDFYTLDYVETMHMNKELEIFDKDAIDDGQVHFIIAVNKSTAYSSLHIYADICTVTIAPTPVPTSAPAPAPASAARSSDCGSSSERPPYARLHALYDAAELQTIISGFHKNISNAMESLANSIGNVEVESELDNIICPACSAEIPVRGILYKCTNCNHKWIVLEWYATYNHRSSLIRSHNVRLLSR